MVLRKAKRRVPWWAKILAKLILSRLPVRYHVWKRLGIFEHGKMEEPEHAIAIFTKHFHMANFHKRKKGFVSLELGPGDSLLSGLIACSLGGTTTYLVDVGRFATEDPRPFYDTASLLLDRGLDVPDIKTTDSVATILQICGTNVLTSGVSSLRTIPDQSVDYIWSNSVLEHVRRGEMDGLLRELRRVIRSDGVACHSVDLKDHLGGALNNLRIPRRLWESNFWASSGFYTNRLRFSELLSLFDDAGFACSIESVDRWKDLPTPKNKLVQAYKHLPEEELCISGFEVTWHPTGITSTV